MPGSHMRLAFLGDPNSVHTRRWLGWFAARGHDVRLLDPFDAEITPGLAAGVTVERCRSDGRGLPLLRLLANRRALRRTLDRLGSQVLHAHYVRRYAWQAAISGFRPLVVSPWGSDILRVPPRALRTRCWNWVALRSATLVTVSSEWMGDASVRAGARRERIRLIHHGVDTRQFAPGPQDRMLAERLGFGDATVILAPRSIRPLYRQPTIVAAVGMLAATQRSLVLVMSARGADPAELATVRAQAAASGISEALRILDDIPHDELPALLRLADVIVSVPDSDSFPVSLLEAMACARPIVVSDLPAVAPVLREIDPTAAALIVPVGDPRATAAAIERALALGPDEQRVMGGHLRDHVVRTADYETNMARMEALYRQLADAG